MKTLTLKEAALELKISPSWLRALCEQGRVREAHRVARGWRPERWLITLEDDYTLHVMPPPHWGNAEVRILPRAQSKRRGV